MYRQLIRESDSNSMSEAALDKLLESLGGGQPIRDLYKTVTMTKNKKDLDIEYLK